VDGRTDTVDVATAAARLGLSTDGVYKRIKRGRLRVQRVDGRTLVVLDSPSTQVDTQSTTGGPADGRTDGLDGQVRPSVDTIEQDHTSPPPLLETNNAPLVEQLQSENAWLRGEVERRDAELAQRDVADAELRRLLALALQRPALPSGATIATPEPATDLVAESATKPRPWWARWAWWRR
jgi:hypothetical protein